MYESHYTHHFFRLWGFKEGQSKNPPTALLLGNSQNNFDAKFGDVAAMAHRRFFLIEFKIDREGIAEEVAPTGKPHRFYLNKHLKLDGRCSMLSTACHFAGYADDENQLVFEQYASAANALADTSEAKMHLGTAFNTELSAMPQDNRICTNFDSFYFAVTCADLTASTKKARAGCYKKGLGLPGKAFVEYIACMYQHLKKEEEQDRENRKQGKKGKAAYIKGKAILCTYHPDTNELIAFVGTLDELVAKLGLAFKELQQSMRVTQARATFTQANAAAGNQAKPTVGFDVPPPDDPMFNFLDDASPAPVAQDDLAPEDDKDKKVRTPTMRGPGSGSGMA